MFVALGIQHAMGMGHIIIRRLPDSTVFFHISQKARFSRKNLLNVKSLFQFSLQRLSETFPILRRHESDMTKNVCSYQILMKLELSCHIFTKYSYQIS